MSLALFDWTGVIVGHWYVIVRDSREDRLWRVISKCGLANMFSTLEIAKGPPPQCERCMSKKTRILREGVFPKGSGSNPRSLRVVPPDLLRRHLLRWDEERILKTHYGPIRGVACEEFDKVVPRYARELIRQAGLGLDFGWMLIGRDCGPYGGRYPRPARSSIRIGNDEESTHRIEVGIIPRDAEFRFDFYLCTGRQADWKTLVSKLRKAADDLNVSFQAMPASPPPSPPVPTSTPKLAAPPPFSTNGSVPMTPASLLNVDANRLETMKGDLERLIAMSREAAAGAEMKAEIQHRYDEVLSRAKPKLDAVKAATERVTAADTQKDEMERALKAAEQALQKAQRDLDSATKDLEWSKNNVIELRSEQTKAAMEAVPLSAELQQAKIDLAEAERLEQDRVRSLSAPEMAGLLAALQQVNT